MSEEKDVDIVYYELKLRSLLEKFLENGYRMKNDVYFNRLLSFLNGKENEELAEILLKLPLMTEWIIRATDIWESNNFKPDHSVSAFTLEFLGLISKDEFVFVNLSKHDVYNRVINTLKVRDDNALPIVKLGYIKLLTCLLRHSAGRNWLIQQNYWTDILTLSLRNQTVYITKEGHFFIAEFLCSLLVDNQKYCSVLWEKIIAPLLINPQTRFKTQNNILEVSDEEIQRFIGPTITLVINILEYFFEKTLEPGNPHLKNFKTILRVNQIVDSIKNFIHIVRDQSLTFQLAKIWILLLYFSVSVENVDGVIKPNIEKDLMEPLYSLLYILTDSYRASVIMSSLNIVMVYWYKLKEKVKVEYLIESDEKLTFENQFTIPQLMPNFIFCYTACHYNVNEDFREDFSSKLSHKMSRTSIRWGYKVREMFRKINVLFELGPTPIANIIQQKNYLARDTAVTTFQSILYTLVDVNSIIEKNPSLVPMFARCEPYLKGMLEALAELILHFNISWQDSIHSLCVFTASINFLKISRWSTKLVIADLNLIRVSIVKYLSPHLALLIDKNDDDLIETLGNLLQTKLHDPEWSVRDSAIEVVSTIAEASYIDFPSFQKIITQNDLCNLILTMALLDGESFVRASAFKCVENMVNVNIYWENHLINQDIIKKVTLFLKCETEGIVRKQAANLLCSIYAFRQRKLPPSSIEDIYTTMCWLALNDLHWDVRLSCLIFCQDRIQDALRNEGMVDDEFPKCTFSIESKKIITLTDEKVKHRIIRALDYLSQIGCLTILKHSISVDCDIQVSKKALEISAKLLDLIKKYKIAESINLPEDGCPSDDSCYFSTVPSTPSPPRKDSDDIIEQILKVSDTSLLKDLYNPGMKTNMGFQHEPSYHFVTVSEFVAFTQRDFKNLVIEREKWINSLDSLSSLLNDMLESYESNDSNAMDCY